MQPFGNLLVGIDLSQVIDPEEAEFNPPVEQAVRRAIWLSVQHAARVTFFSVLEPRSEFWALLNPEEQERLSQNAQTLAENTLAKLVDRARQSGVEAESKLVHGKGWIELTRQAVRGNHDLVIVGTRDVSAVNRLLFGTTAMKLLRECPVPVWVAKPELRLELRNVLIAVDLSELCSQVVELGLALRAFGAKNIQIVHVADFPLDRIWSTSLPSDDTQRYHQEIRSRAEKHLTDELDRQLGGGASPDIQVRIIDGSVAPGLAIRHHIEAHPVDLLVMGTMARHGAAGFFLGSTAEWLLPQIPCSLVAIKPAGFQTRIPPE